VRIVLLPSCPGGSLAYQYLSTFRVNDTVALAKLATAVPVFAVHLKARYREAILSGLAGSRLDGVQVVEPGRVYRF
jgi:hypothetical protein